MDPAGLLSVRCDRFGKCPNDTGDRVGSQAPKHRVQLLYPKPGGVGSDGGRNAPISLGVLRGQHVTPQQIGMHLALRDDQLGVRREHIQSHSDRHRPIPRYRPPIEL